jgi:hypothetical protein
MCGATPKSRIDIISVPKVEKRHHLGVIDADTEYYNYFMEICF